METHLYSEMAAVEEAHWWFRARRSIVFDLLHRYAPGKSLLDVGLGTGHNAALFIKEGYEVTGLEPSAEAVSLAVQKVPELKIIQAPFPSALVPDASFDIIMLLDVIEHLQDDAEALTAVHRALKPGGIVIITTPAFPFLWSRHDELAHHYRRYTYADLRGKLLAAQLHPELLSHYNFFLFPAIALVRLAYKSLGIVKQTSDFGTTPRLLNAPLTWLFGSERFLLRLFPLPFGVSLVAVAKKS